MVACYLRGVNCCSGVRIIFIYRFWLLSNGSIWAHCSSCWLGGNPSLLGCQSFFANIFIENRGYDKLQQCMNCLCPSLFVAESILHRALAIIEWKQTHSLGLAIPWDISRHDPSASLLTVCSVFSICTWHRMLEQCTEETSSSRLDCGELRVRIIMTEDNSRKHSDYWGVFIKYLQIRRQPEDLGLGQQTLSRALFGLRGLDKSHLSFICGCLLW